MSLYIIVARFDRASLEVAVNEKMSDGYYPYGGISVVNDSNRLLYNQAMVKLTNTLNVTPEPIEG